MDRSLWITWYDLPADRRDVHLKWTHGTYIPRMLKRPGFLWAAHYKSEAGVRQAGVPPGAHGRLRHTDDPAVPTGNQYILAFGAADAQAFSKPVPSAIHAALPEKDRNMLSQRAGERVHILTEESRADGPEAKRRKAGKELAPCIQLGTFNSGSADNDEILAWYTQWRLPSMRKLPGCVGIRKMVSVTGWAKHSVLYEFVSVEARNKYFPDHEKATPEMDAWTDRLVRKLLHAPGSPNVAGRIWPPVKSDGGGKKRGR
ncbi:MAG: hypothetical protein ACRET6_14220 [Burkholderiales bacterium]